MVKCARYELRSFLRICIFIVCFTEDKLFLFVISLFFFILIKEILHYRNNKGYIFTIFMIGWDHWIKKRVKHLSSIEGMGIWKTFSVLPKMPRCLFLHYKIVFFFWLLYHSSNALLISNCSKLFSNVQPYGFLSIDVARVQK